MLGTVWIGSRLVVLSKGKRVHEDRVCREHVCVTVSREPNLNCTFFDDEYRRVYYRLRSVAVDHNLALGSSTIFPHFQALLLSRFARRTIDINMICYTSHRTHPIVTVGVDCTMRRYVGDVLDSSYFVWRLTVYVQYYRSLC